jgi:uncharacterized protein YukJ
MRLPNYGLLTGSLVDHGPQQGGNPHYQLFVEADGIRYRAAINLESTVSAADVPPELEYQVIPDLKSSGKAGAAALAAQITNQKTFSVNDGQPALDFVRGNILDMTAFTMLPRGTPPENNEFYQDLVEAAGKANNNGNAWVAVFGTGFPPNHSGNSNSPTAFTGVDNVHMNQGNYRLIGNQVSHFYRENAPNQDGAVLFFHEDGTVQGFFTKFHSQDTETDQFGNPVHTGVIGLDDRDGLVAIPSEVRARLGPPNPFAHLLNAPAPTAAPAAGGGGIPPFVFAETMPDPDPNLRFLPDDDSSVRNSPFVEQFARNGVPEPVPRPRDGKYPTMKLADVLGEEAVDAIAASGQIVFHAVGDTGAASQHVLSHEDAVAALMVKDFAAPDEQERPAFFFHLGDVVYYFGEQQFYYEQFYRPYKNYPAPIFAIPGNHDGITYNKDMISLDPFLKAFCDSQPRHWEGAGGISRTTMTQPGVYFTLDAPLVSIIGLYSNCSESFGYLDQQQKLFLYKELARLKELRADGQIVAILLAVHHPPLSFHPGEPSSVRMRDDIDKACQEAKCWPDAVLSGHAHIYQRMTRDVTTDTGPWQVPYIVAGSGGNFNPSQEIDKAGVKLLDQEDKQFKLHHFLANYGYLRVIVSRRAAPKHPTLRIEFHSPDAGAGHPSADACVLDLTTHQYVM